MNRVPDHRILPLGDDCALVTFGNEISIDLNNQVLALAEMLSGQPFEGFLETVPAYSSLAVYFDPFAIYRDEVTGETAFDSVCEKIETALGELSDGEIQPGRQIAIAAVFGGEAGPDIQFVAEHNGISETEVIEIFTSQEYRVFFLGFLPGFPYMGELDPRIRAPRKETPRTSVPAGSIGIAGNQTGIYPLESPGGWQIIGRTEVKMFDPGNPEPAFLRPGDIVRFINKGN